MLLSLGDDKEWIEALTYSTHVATAYQMSQLFVTIVIFCDATNPQQLLDKHWLNMCDDIIYKIRSECQNPDLIILEQELKSSLLFELEKLFNMSSKWLKDFHLPMPKREKILELNDKLLNEELNYDRDEVKQQHATFFQN